jgi:hypothetical protein
MFNQWSPLHWLAGGWQAAVPYALVEQQSTLQKKKNGKYESTFCLTWTEQFVKDGRVI